MNAPTSTPLSGATTESPSAIFGFDDAIVATVVSALVTAYGPSLGTAMGAAFKRNEHLFVRIEASWKEESNHYVILALTNLTEHGLYIESILISGPQNPAIDIGRYQGKGKESFQFSGSGPAPGNQESGNVFPLLLPSLTTNDKQSVRFLIQIPEEDPGSASAASVANSIQAVIGYSRLNNKEQETKKVLVRLRHEGPAYHA